MPYFYRYSVPVVLISIILSAGVNEHYWVALSGSFALGLVINRLMDDIEFDNRPPFPAIINKGPCHIYFNDTDYPDWLQVSSGDIFQYSGLDYTKGFPNRMIEGGLVYFGVVYKINTNPLPYNGNKKIN